jgi:hypothetical protein
MRSIFNEIRAYPNGRSFLFDEIDYQDFKGIPALAPYTDALRQALRSGDPNECAKTGDLKSMCRAYMALDKSLCRVGGKLAEAQVELPDRKKGEPAKLKLKGGLETSCRRVIESRAFLAKGLNAVAESGPPREREFAKAALGQADACATFARQAVDLCAASAQGTAAGTPLPGTPMPGAAAPAPVTP